MGRCEKEPNETSKNKKYNDLSRYLIDKLQIKKYMKRINWNIDLKKLP